MMQSERRARYRRIYVKVADLVEDIGTGLQRQPPLAGESGVVAEAGSAMAQTGRLDVEVVPKRRPPVACLDLSSPHRHGTTSSTPKMGPASIDPR
jgi:hypothetical protein